MKNIVEFGYFLGYFLMSALIMIFLNAQYASDGEGPLGAILVSDRALTLIGGTPGIILTGITSMRIEIAKRKDTYLVNRYTEHNCACNN